MSPTDTAVIVLVALPLLPLAITLLNVWTWRRGRPDGRAPGAVSMLIPARNEADNIEDCLAAAQASEHPVLEILVYDDASTDDTAALVTRRAAADPRIRLIRGADLPRGWAGKSHACHRLGQVAQGDILLFIDADVRLEPQGVARLVSGFEDVDADLVTAVPRQETRTWAERLVLPLLHLTYTSWLPLFLIHRSRDTRFLAANGQVLSIKRNVFDAIGGFASVKDDVVEDMAFCRRVKQAGHRVAFFDGHHLARCRMYRSAGEVWDGFSKNLYGGLGANPNRLLAVYALYLVCFVAPYVLLGVGIAAEVLGWPSASTLWGAGLVGVSANLLLRIVLAVHFRQAWTGVVSHPVGVFALLTIGINSLIWHQRGTIRWRGRVYGSQADLHTTAPPAR